MRHSCSLTLAACLLTATTFAADIFVSPRGNDAWTGTLPEPNSAESDGPVATLTRAQELVRQALKQSDSEAVRVVVREGLYELSAPLTLTAEDSGNSHRTVTWMRSQDESITVSGGRRLSGWKPVDDPRILARLPSQARAHVLHLNLKQQGVQDLGTVAEDLKRAELFFNGQPMTLARWPNNDFVTVKSILNIKPFKSHGIAGDYQGTFVYDGDRPTRWLEESEPWLSGYWFWDWSDQRQQVAKIDVASSTIELKPPFHHYGFRPGQRYYAFNLLAELDAPGEWYLDRENGELYFWPPTSNLTTSDELEFSIAPALFELRRTSYVTIEGFDLENCRGTAVTIDEGEYVKVVNCRVRNVGGWAVSLSGRDSEVSGCEIYNAGEGGISLSGGDRIRLVPARLKAHNNHIHHYARLVRTYRPAVSLSGVGHVVSHNLIHHAPHNAIQLSGNDHLIEFNELHDVCQETGDVGAFYMGRDWTMRGNVLKHNYFHDIRGPGLHGAMAVYLDDAASGTTVYGNVFYRASRAAFIGGGRDNLVENNIFVECEPSVHLDARGLGWMHETVEPGGVMPERLAAMPYKQPPWSTRYPELVNIVNEQPAAPQGNRVQHNISVGGQWKNVEAAAEPGIVFEGNLVDVDPLFVDRAGLNFNLRPNSPALAEGFKAIPFSEIGLLKK